MSPAAFSAHHFQWIPYPYQEEVLNAVLLRGATRVAWIAGRRVGKTDAIANAALQLAVTRPGIHIAILAPTFRQAAHLSSRVRAMLQGSAFEHYLVVDRASELRLRFGRDARGKARDSVISAGSMGSRLRGQGADVLIIDESAFCKPEDYRTKALPLVADKPAGVIIHISTIWAEDDHFMDAFRRYRQHPRGAVFRTPTSMNPNVTPAMLEEWRATMTEADFLREFMAEVVQVSGVFDRRALNRCFHDYRAWDLATLGRLEPKDLHAYYVGVDWGKKQDRAVVAVVEQPTHLRANPAKVVLLQVYEPDPDNETHYTRILEDIQRVARHVSAHRVVMDEGEGAHQAEVLARTLGSRLVPVRYTEDRRDYLIRNALYLVEKGLLQLPAEPDELRRAFLNVQRNKLGGFEHASRKSKDVFDAVSLALGFARLGAPRRAKRGMAVRKPQWPGEVA